MTDHPGEYETLALLSGFPRPDGPPDIVIGDPADPYLLRWFVIPHNKMFNVFYHRMLRDDHDVPHDHPWPSFSIMMRGQLREVLKDGSSRTLAAGDWVYRGPEFAHRLELVDHGCAETLFITGPKVRDWGFHCPNGWKHWRAYFDPDSPGEVGSGCGETIR